MGRKEALSPELRLSPGDYRHMGSAHAAVRSPGVWDAPGIEPAISRLLFSCPTGGWRQGRGGLHHHVSHCTAVASSDS